VQAAIFGNNKARYAKAQRVQECRVNNIIMLRQRPEFGGKIGRR
jgi:hypothetical protein